MCKTGRILKNAFVRLCKHQFPYLYLTGSHMSMSKRVLALESVVIFFLKIKIFAVVYSVFQC